jgi:hypothetical protein
MRCQLPARGQGPGPVTVRCIMMLGGHCGSHGHGGEQSRCGAPWQAGFKLAQTLVLY